MTTGSSDDVLDMNFAEIFNFDYSCNYNSKTPAMRLRYGLSPPKKVKMKDTRIISSSNDTNTAATAGFQIHITIPTSQILPTFGKIVSDDFTNDIINDTDNDLQTNVVYITKRNRNDDEHSINNGNEQNEGKDHDACTQFSDDMYTLLSGLCNHSGNNNNISSTACIEKEDLPLPSIKGSFTTIDRDVIGIVIEIKEEDDVELDIKSKTMQEAAYYKCGYDHDHNHGTLTRIISGNIDHTLSYLVGGSSKTSNQTTIEVDAEHDEDEDSGWGYYDNASLSDQSILRKNIVIAGAA